MNSALLVANGVGVRFGAHMTANDRPLFLSYTRVSTEEQADSRAIRSAAFSSRAFAFAFTCGARPPCVAQTDAPLMATFRHGSPFVRFAVQIREGSGVLPSAQSVSLGS